MSIPFALGLLLAVVLGAAACRSYPVPAVELLPLGEFRHKALSDVGPVTVQVAIGASGDEMAGHVDTESLEAIGRKRLEECSVPQAVLGSDTYPYPMLSMVVDVRRGADGYVFAATLDLVQEVTVKGRTAERETDAATWSTSALGSTRTRASGGLNAALGKSAGEMFEVFCSEYRRAEAAQQGAAPAESREEDAQ